MDNQLKAAILAVLVSFGLTAYAYPWLPPQIATHWDAAGEVNGYMPAGGAFFVPVLMAVLLLVFVAIPRIDPLRANIKAFARTYWQFVLVMSVFMLALQAQVLLWNTGTLISFNLTMPVLLGCLLFYAGIVLGKAKQNWFVGIRTPWTLSSEEVWNRTHALGSKLFKASGILCVLSVFLPAYAFPVVIALMVGLSLGLVAYSYVLYERLIKAGKKRPERPKTR